MGGTPVGRDSLSELTFRKPSAEAAQCYVNEDGWSSGRHAARAEEERKPIEHTYNFLDDQTEGTACLQGVCVKLDPRAVDIGPVEPPSHTYSFLDDHTEGLGCDPHAVTGVLDAAKPAEPPSHTYNFLDDHTEMKS